jgi:hypothetical protein
MSLDRKDTSTMASTEGQALPAPIKSLINFQDTISQPVFAAFIAGGIAGAVSRTVVSPLERLKILYQVQSVGREDYKMSVGKGLMKMWREEGFKGLMRGNGANCLRIVPYSAVQFGSYNFYKRVGKMTILLRISCPTDSVTLTSDSNSLLSHRRVRTSPLSGGSCVELRLESHPLLPHTHSILLEHDFRFNQHHSLFSPMYKEKLFLVCGQQWSQCIRLKEDCLLYTEDLYPLSLVLHHM